MKEMNITSINQGVTMKKALFVVAVAAMLVFAFAATAMAATNFVGSAPTYLSWNVVSESYYPGGGIGDIAAQEFGPHGSYTANTIKCAICHSVHAATSGSVALTGVTGGVAGASVLSASCAYCHGVGGFTDLQVAVSKTTGSDHAGACAGGCHANSPHGVGVSAYKVLAQKLLSDRSNRAIANAINAPLNGDGQTGMTQDLMDLAVGQDAKLALTMATAYTCAGDGNGVGLQTCHNSSAFGVAQQNQVMDISGDQSGTWLSGHPVYSALDTADWSQPGATYGSQIGAQIAWKPTTGTAVGCDACHDVNNTDISAPAFPHNQVEAADGSTGKGTDGGDPLLYAIGDTNASILWMTKAADAAGTGQATIAGPDQNANMNTSPNTYRDYQKSYMSIADGVCLKCHISTDGLSGVGKTF
jgi:hypothetical protein